MNLLTIRSKEIRHKILAAVVIAVMVGYFTPFVLLRQNSYITIHDNLDGEFVDKCILVATGKALNFGENTSFENIMNGLPRAALPSGLNVSVLLFYCFGPAAAYIANHILVHMIAFFGMFLLLRRHVLTDEDDLIYAVVVSLLFFLVPYYTTHGLSVAGQPMLAYALLNVRSGRCNWKDYLIVMLFPLWSNIALIAPFATSVLLLIFVVDWIKSRRLNARFLLAMAILNLVFLVANYQLINSVFHHQSNWVSHRSAWSAWSRWGDNKFGSNFKNSLEILFTTQYHTGSFWTLPIMVATGVCFVLLLKRKKPLGPMAPVLVAILLICLEYGFYDWVVLVFGPFMPALVSFNAGRFYFLLPLLWFVLLAMCLKEFMRNGCGGCVLWFVVVCQMYAVLKFNTEFKNNVALLRGKDIYEPTFQDFFAVKTFDEVAAYIGRPKQDYRVVSLGMHPSIAQFNGFYTLDSYLSDYSLSYKLQFRQIISKELDKSPPLREYFDGWGNRCYLFSSELGLDCMCGGRDRRTVQHLQIDSRQLRNMGGEYVISAVRIENCESSGLHLDKHFSTPGSFWDIYLYDVF